MFPWKLVYKKNHSPTQLQIDQKDFNASTAPTTGDPHFMNGLVYKFETDTWCVWMNSSAHAQL